MGQLTGAGKDLKFGGRSSVNNTLSLNVATQFSLCHLLTLYVLHDQTLITYVTSSNEQVSSENSVSLQDIFKEIYVFSSDKLLTCHNIMSHMDSVLELSTLALAACNVNGCV